MSAQHTPGPYTVEKAVVFGYRGGKRFIGWHLKIGDRKIKLFQFAETARDEAARLNTPLTTPPTQETDYWQLTETGYWLYTWVGSEHDFAALREGRAFAAIAKASGSPQ